MSKKSTKSMKVVNIEQGDLLPVIPPPHLQFKSGQHALPKNITTLPTYSLEDDDFDEDAAVEKKVVTGPMARTPDEMFHRVTSGLIKLDRSKRMHALGVQFLTFSLRILLVTVLVCIMLMIAAQFDWSSLLSRLSSSN